jgi:hypothetical protein
MNMNNVFNAVANYFIAWWNTEPVQMICAFVGIALVIAVVCSKRLRAWLF